MRIITCRGLAPLVCLAVASIAAPIPASAQVASTGADEKDGPPRYAITVTAGRVEEAVEESGSSVTVLDADQIEATGARWLGDVLRAVPGVSVVRSGPAGGVTSVFLRGTNSNHVLVLVNGVKLNSPSTGGFDLAAIPASLVERVEILRGPQGTLYGSNAIGGVINVITRSGRGPAQLGVSVETGSFDTSRFDAALSGEASGFRYSVSAAVSDSAGFSAADSRAGNVEPDGYHNVVLDGRLGIGRSGGFDAEAFVTYLDGRADIDGFAFGVGPVDDDNQVQETTDLYAGIAAGYEWGAGRTSLTVSTTEGDLGTVDPDGFFTAFDLSSSVRELDWQTRLDLGAVHSLVAGLEARSESARTVSTSVFGATETDDSVGVTGVFLQDRLTLGERLHLTAGIRREDHERFGSETTFRVTSSLGIGAGVRVRGSAGSGFRAPSLNELYYPGFGNPGLAPERSIGFDIGAGGRWHDGRIRADVTFFDNEIEDLIEFGASGFVNLSRIDTRGVEASGSWSPAASLQVGGSYTWTRAVAAGDEVQLLRRPRHQGSISVRFDPSARMEIYAELVASGARFDSGALGRVQLQPYTVLNARARIGVLEDLDVVARIENALDARYQEVFGYGAAGASFMVGLRYRISSGH